MMIICGDDLISYYEYLLLVWRWWRCCCVCGGTAGGHGGMVSRSTSHTHNTQQHTTTTTTKTTHKRDNSIRLYNKNIYIKFNLHRASVAPAKNTILVYIYTLKNNYSYLQHTTFNTERGGIEVHTKLHMMKFLLFTLGLGLSCLLRVIYFLLLRLINNTRTS